jgi:N utilization substance protein B
MTEMTEKVVKTRSASPRSRAREFALQAIYQWMVGKNEMSSVDAFTRDLWLRP